MVGERVGGREKEWKEHQSTDLGGREEGRDEDQ